ncbi:Fic family protein [Rudaea sp.]|uniref:Fic family protein n=1 Tax=Rudaea sp. TaxID=2136325 RepID=UPI0039E5E073
MCCARGRSARRSIPRESASFSTARTHPGAHGRIEWVQAKKYIRSHPLLTALVSMVAITNCHPFRDGNGRTSRVMSNSALCSAQLLRENVYIPLYECFWLSHRGYEIRVRIAEIKDDWEPLMQYICDVVSVLCKLDCAATEAFNIELLDLPSTNGCWA